MADKTPLLIGIPRAFLWSLFGFLWGCGLFFAGGGFSSSDVYADSGYLQLRTMGLVIFFVSLIGLIYQVMKGRAPEKRTQAKERVEPRVEAKAEAFDADLAFSNYMKNRAQAAEDVPADADVDRPVVRNFGRKGAGSSDNV